MSWMPAGWRTVDGNLSRICYLFPTFGDSCTISTVRILGQWWCRRHNHHNYRQYHKTKTTVTKVYNDLLLAADDGDVTAVCLLDLTTDWNLSSIYVAPPPSCFVHIWLTFHFKSCMLLARWPLLCAAKFGPGSAFMLYMADPADANIQTRCITFFTKLLSICFKLTYT